MHNTFASIVVGFTVGCFVKLFTGPIVEIPTFAEPPAPEVTFVIEEDKESVIPGIMQDDLDALLDAIERRLGVVTLEKMARMHNGGPNGHKKEATKKYWDKVWEVIVRKRKEKVQRFLQHIHNAGTIPPK
jgi:hypothetical protein